MTIGRATQMVDANRAQTRGAQRNIDILLSRLGLITRTFLGFTAQSKNRFPRIVFRAQCDQLHDFVY
jgi:hypothetical protein